MAVEAGTIKGGAVEGGAVEGGAVKVAAVVSTTGNSGSSAAAGTSVGATSAGSDVGGRVVAGCFVESGLFAVLKGRTGAEDKDPIAVAGLLGPEEGLIFGEGIAESADPGRSGNRRPVNFARLFCAAIVSLMEGLAAGTEVVLRENAGALPGVSEASGFCGFGLKGSSRRSSCCFFSRESMILVNTSVRVM